MTDTTTDFLAPLVSRERELAQSGPDWVRRLRRAGRERFGEIGFPTTRQEEWRATNVSPIAKTAFRPAAQGKEAPAERDLPAAARLDLGGPRLVFLDGILRPDLSSATGSAGGLWTGSLATALAELPDRVRPLLQRRDLTRTAAFDALNAAFIGDGAVVLVDEDHQVEQPIQLLFGSTGRGEPTVSQPRVLIDVSSGGSARVTETYFALGDDAYFTNAVTDMAVGENAQLDHCRLQLEGPAAYHVATIASCQARSSELVSHNVSLGGRLVRHDVQAVLEGEGANCVLDGLYLTRAEQHMDNHTTIDHAMPHCDSREVYKGILDDRSRAVFNGRIVVRPDAQKTDAKQSNPNLLLSNGALAHTRPQLEIYADDVKCTHGATVGRLDEDAIFYLRSRGIGLDEARKVLIRAFADEVLDRIPVEPVRELLRRTVAGRLDLSREAAS